MDRSRIYTAANAEDVKPGTLGFFGDTIEGIEVAVHGHLNCLRSINGIHSQSRFRDSEGYSWELFYPAEQGELDRLTADIIGALHLSGKSAKAVAQLPGRKIFALHQALCEEEEDGF